MRTTVAFAITFALLVPPAGARAVESARVAHASNGRTRVINLADGADVWFLGSPAKDQLGNDMRCGDVNSDGIDDLIMGAQWSSAAGRNIVGRSYVMFGRQDWPERVDFIRPERADWSFFGAGREARMGSAVGTGDVSGDGHSDLLLASLLADPMDQHNGGAVYIMLGGPDAGGYHDFMLEPADALLAGESRRVDSDQLGTDLRTGDFNADGITDVAVAASFREEATGAVFVWWGPIAKGSVHNLQTHPADWTILGPQKNSWFGAALAVGDITGDGVDDLLASAIKTGREGDPDASGAVFVFAGSESHPAVTDLAVDAPTSLVIGTTGSQIGVAMAVGSCSCRGHPIHVGEVTGDEHPDLVIGAPTESRLTGSVSIVPGPLGAGRLVLSEIAVTKLTGSATSGRLGWWIETGRLDGDGKTDLLLAAPWADASGRTKTGIVYGLRGPVPAGTRPIDGFDPPLLVYGPDQSSGNAGASLVLTDTDGDGVDDLHVGLPDAEPLGRRSAGSVYLLSGPLLETLATATATSTATPTATATSTASPTPTATHTQSPTPTPSLTTRPPTPTATPSAPTATMAPPNLPLFLPLLAQGV